mgnify:CR=1 FL=1
MLHRHTHLPTTYVHTGAELSCHPSYIQPTTNLRHLLPKLKLPRETTPTLAALAFPSHHLLDRPLLRLPSWLAVLCGLPSTVRAVNRGANSHRLRCAKHPHADAARQDTSLASRQERNSATTTSTSAAMLGTQTWSRCVLRAPVKRCCHPWFHRLI